MNPIAIRLLSQQLVAPQFSDPAEVVSYMGAMQAQEYRMISSSRRPSSDWLKRFMYAIAYNIKCFIG